jgi:hypothetical protein
MNNIIKSIENHWVEIFVIVVRLELISIDYSGILNNSEDLIDRIARFSSIVVAINKHEIVNL